MDDVTTPTKKGLIGMTISSSGFGVRITLIKLQGT